MKESGRPGEWYGEYWLPVSCFLDIVSCSCCCPTKVIQSLSVQAKPKSKAKRVVSPQIPGAQSAINQSGQFEVIIAPENCSLKFWTGLNLLYPAHSCVKWQANQQA